MFSQSNKDKCIYYMYIIIITYTYTHRKTYIFVFVCERETFILKDWPMQFWELTHLKSAGQANRLKSQGRADNVISGSKHSGGRIHFL